MVGLIIYRVVSKHPWNNFPPLRGSQFIGLCSQTLCSKILWTFDLYAPFCARRKFYLGYLLGTWVLLNLLKDSMTNFCFGSTVYLGNLMDSRLLSECWWAGSLPCAVVMMISSAAALRIFKSNYFIWWMPLGTWPYSTEYIKIKQ